MRQAMTILLRTGAAIAAFCACLGVSAIAQRPERLPGSFITGQVLSATSDAPLRRVRIDVTRGSWRGEPVLTGNDGRFEIDLERAGPVTVVATKGGYLVAKTTVQQADLTRPLLLKLPRGAVITGTVIDEKGQPAVSTSIRAKRLDPAVDGFPSDSSASTDDRGEYRLAGLAPGRYELVAGLDIVLQGDVLLSGRPGPPTPGIVITVGAGDQIGGVQVTVPESRSSVDGMLRSMTNQPGPSPPRGISAGSGPGGVRGRVLTAARKPVVAATVRLTGQTVNYSTRTDANGGFSITGLRSGRYTLEAVSSPLIGNWGYGQDTSNSVGTPVIVADRIEDGLDIILPQYRSIQGLVVDENGEPLQGARVQALQVEYAAGRLTTVPVGNERRTDDQGSYRIWGLPEGTYLLSAVVDGLFTDGRGGRAAYAPIYHPGTPLAAAASSIELRDDSTINLVFSPVAMTQITGKARDHEGPLVGGTVRLVESRRPGTVAAAPRTASIQADGSFLIRNVPPGDYVLHVRGDGPGRTGMFATETVSVGSDPVDLVVRTSHGASVEGRTVLEGTQETVTCRVDTGIVAPAGMPVPNGCEGGRMNFTVTPVALDDRARSEATMVFGWSANEFFGLGLFGRLAFALRSAPSEDWYLKSFTINGQDIADSGFDFGTQPDRITDAEIILSRNGASITGRRSDARAGGQGYFALAFSPAYESLPPLSRRMKFTRSATDGSFRIGGLPAGDYLVVAVPRLKTTEWQNPELLRQLAPRAERITLSEGQSANVSVRVLER
jgi:protocatechuate 3,4-dioxygenase beta subunit